MNSPIQTPLMRSENETHLNWADHIQEVHRVDPGFTSRSFAELKNNEGLNSYAWLAQLVPESQSLSVLDLACGDGELTAQVLARLGSNGRVSGVDLSMAEIERAKGRVLDTRASFVHGRAEALPFSEHSFDFVLCHLALMLMNPAKTVIREVARVLKPGGHFAAVLPAPLDDDLLRALSRICLEFLDECRPGWRNSWVGDAQLSSDKGLAESFSSDLGFLPLRLETQHFAMKANAEGVWRLLRGNYFFGLLNSDEESRLQAQVMKYIQTPPGRRVRVEMPFRFLSAQTQAR